MKQHVAVPQTGYNKGEKICTYPHRITLAQFLKNRYLYKHEALLNYSFFSYTEKHIDIST